MGLCSLHFADKDRKPDGVRRLPSAAGDHRCLEAGGWQPGHSMAALSCCTAAGRGGGAGRDPARRPPLPCSPALGTWPSFFFFAVFLTLSAMALAPGLAPAHHSGHWPSVSTTGSPRAQCLPPHPSPPPYLCPSHKAGTHREVYAAFTATVYCLSPQLERGLRDSGLLYHPCCIPSAWSRA